MSEHRIGLEDNRPYRAASEAPRACDIEIVERVPAKYLADSPGIVKPDQIRINGVPVLAPKDEPVIVPEIALRAGEPVKVTLTLFARHVVIAEEAAG